MSNWRRLAIFFVMAVGQFMALLDIQIVVASMGSIQGGLSASQDEIDWIQTAYLMAEIVMIPLCAYLAQALTTRWVFVASAGLFTAVSLFCGVAWDLPSMVICRAVQGFVGGAMIPLVFATGFSFFDGAQAAMATAVLGVISTLAPTLGPAIGGLITDTLGWRWLFFINIAPGMLVTLALVLLGGWEKPEVGKLAHIDWLHAASLAAFLGGLQYVLEEGPQRSWMQDRGVAAMAWIALVAGLVFLERCLFSPRPLVKIAPFRQRGFTGASILSFVIGFGIFTSTYLPPVFLARVRDFTSLDIGSTVFVAGVFMSFSAAPAAWLATKLDLRLVMAAGLVLFGVSFLMMTDMAPDWGFWQLFWPQVVRGGAVLLCMVPAVGMALRDIPDELLKDASGLNTLFRNLGGAVGIAVVNTWLIGFTQAHGAGLGDALGQGSGATDSIMSMAQRLGAAGVAPTQAMQIAAQSLAGGVAQQALTLAFNDVFQLSAWLFFGAVFIIPFCRGGPMTQQGPGAGFVH
ncbi:MAG TPA: DHA2 family efflux MFS transporter permease subunit [Caulobacteraceae bacterium]|jgi:DHA2 family multidrug resistance protein